MKQKAIIIASIIFIAFILCLFISLAINFYSQNFWRDLFATAFFILGVCFAIVAGYILYGIVKITVGTIMEFIEDIDD